MQSKLTSTIFHKLKYTSYKRPYLEILQDFNISHSGNLMACAITENGPIGIDIEVIAPEPVDDLCDFLPSGLFSRVMQSADPVKQFYHYWTMIESVIKADGRGFYVPVKDIRIEDNIATTGDRTWITHQLNIAPHYCASVAISEHQEINVRKLSISEL